MSPDTPLSYENEPQFAAAYGAGGAPGGELPTLTAPAFAPLSGQDSVGESAGIELLLDVVVEVSVELGRRQMTIGEVMALRSSSVIELDKLAGEPADILVNGTRIARGEVVVVDEKFGVRVLDVETRAKRLRSMG